MFPGQGSQYHKMGLELYQTEPVFQEVLDKGFEILKEQSNINFKKILFENEIDPEKINETYYSQALIFIFEFALASYLLKLGIKPDMMIGHSIGEYTAACLGGVFSFEDTIKILLKRGSLMKELPAGQMMAVSTSQAKIEKFLNEDISIAAYNSPLQCVCSGPIEAIESLGTQLKQNGIGYKILKTTKAFHSQMMDNILEPFSEFISTMKCQESTLPYISSISGKKSSKAEMRSPNYWTKQIRETVDFSAGIKTLLKSDDYVFIEIGPGDALTKLVKQNDQDKKAIEVFNLIKRKNELEKDGFYFTSGLGKLWRYGVDINWSIYHQISKRKVSIPGYCFDQQFFQTEVELNLDQSFSLKNNELVDDKKLKKTKNADLDKTDKIFSPSIELIDTIDKVSTNVTVPTDNQSILKFLKDFFENDEIELQSNFYELGGDSLRAVSLINSIFKKFNVKIPIQFFLEEPTIKSLIKEIEERSWINNNHNHTNTLEI